MSIGYSNLSGCVMYPLNYSQTATPERYTERQTALSVSRSEDCWMFSASANCNINQSSHRLPGRISHKRKGVIDVESAFSTANLAVMGTGKKNAHSNKITAMPKLLNVLDIKDKLVTIDAMGGQKDIVELICKKEDDYLLAS